MGETLWAVISLLNQGGEIFVKYAWDWLAQSCVLLAILTYIDNAFDTRQSVRTVLPPRCHPGRSTVVPPGSLRSSFKC
jgi:hypothetical protein